MVDDVEATWAKNEEIGQASGHVVTRCPGCGARAMTSILNASGTSRWAKSGGGWPRCKQCCPGRDAPRVEPVGDVNLVARVRPGHPPRDAVVRALATAALAVLAGEDDGAVVPTVAAALGARPGVTREALTRLVEHGWARVAARPRRYSITPEGKAKLHG